MAGNFNFTTKLGLDAQGFNRGVHRVMGALNNLKTSFLSVASALGAGLGFTQLISSLRVTATELSVAMNTLKNVSYQTKAFKEGTEEVTIEVSNFADNLSFVKRVSKEYHQDLVAITDNYAKFTAACKKTNLGLEEQRFVFEALTKAAAYYHLSADRTADMMNAVTQMMSKGKVAAEELRRQLGNTLPGAFNLMAAAMGVSTAKLDEMMRNGEVLAAEVLPKFAAMLNSVTKNIEFDSIQSSLNDLKNSWYEFVEKSGAEKLYKNIIDGSVTALGVVNDNMKGIKSVFVGLLTYLASINIFGFFEKQGEKFLKELEKDLKVARAKMGELSRGFYGLEGKGTIVKGSHDTYSLGNIFNLNTRKASQLKKALQEYNNQLIEINRLELKLGRISQETFNEIVNDVNNANHSLGTWVEVLDEGAPKIGRLQTAWNGLKSAVDKATVSVGNFFKANWVFLLIAAISSVVSYIGRIKKEAKEIAEIANNYKNDIKVITDTSDENITILKNNLKILKNTANAEHARALALKEINKELGTSYKLDELDKVKGKYAEITAEVERWAEATKKQALLQAYASQIAEATAKKKTAEIKLEDRQDDDIMPNKWVGTLAGPAGHFIFKGKNSIDKNTDIKNLQNEISQYDKVIAEAMKEMEKLGVSLGDFYDILGGNLGETESVLSEVFKKYNKEAKELANQLKEGALTQDKYDEAFDKLVKSIWEAATATGELSISSIIEKLDKGKVLTDLEKWYYDLSKAAAEAARNALIKDISKEIDEAIKLADEQLEKEFEKYAEKQEKELLLNMGVAAGDYKPNSRKDRNTLFDYDKTESEKLNDELEQTNDWLDDIKKKYGDLIKESTELGYRTEMVQKELDELSELLQYASKEAKTLEAAMNYAKIQEDIKNVKKEINGLVYSGVKDFATSIDRVVDAWDNLEETMNDSDASGWEKFMSVFNLITQVIDSAMSVMQTITTIQELQTKLGAAKIAEQQALNELLKEELALRMAAAGASNEEIAERLSSIGALLMEKGLLAGILGLKKQENAASATGAALKTSEAAASTAAAGASAGEAIAGATASGAKMPFPYNLLAIAAGVAAVIGALAAMSKFEKGGIVGGNSMHGDRNLVRANSGEMILTKGQQGTLWAMLNGKGSIGGNVEFKIRGADLVGAINNYSKKISK